MSDYCKEKLEGFFTDLKESEDEWIKTCIQVALTDVDEQRFNDYGTTLTDCIAWLEKQKCLTTDEDKQGKEDVLWCIEQARKNAKDENDMGTCWFAEKWLEKQGEQKPAEWSKKDEEYQDLAIQAIEYYFVESNPQRRNCINWLKSLKPRRVQCDYNPYKEIVEFIAEMCEKYESPLSNLSDFLNNVKVKCKEAKEYDTMFPENHWKPSEEQMEALKKSFAIMDNGFDKENLRSLYCTLKHFF